MLAIVQATANTIQVDLQIECTVAPLVDAPRLNAEAPTRILYVRGVCVGPFA